MRIETAEVSPEANAESLARLREVLRGRPRGVLMAALRRGAAGKVVLVHDRDAAGRIVGTWSGADVIAEIGAALRDRRAAPSGPEAAADG